MSLALLLFSLVMFGFALVCALIFLALTVRSLMAGDWKSALVFGALFMMFGLCMLWIFLTGVAAQWILLMPMMWR